MDQLEEVQRKRRFIFYIVFLIVFVLGAFYSGYRWAITLHQYQTNWAAVASLAKWSNVIGLAMDLVGATIVVWNTDGFNKAFYMWMKKEMENIQRGEKRRKKFNWIGSIVFLIGMLLQLISAILS